GGGAHVGGGTGEGGAEGGGGERADHGPRVVGGDRDDAVLGADAERAQMRGHPPYPLAKLAAGQLLSRPVPVAADQRYLLVLLGRTRAQQVLGVAQPQAREEARKLAAVVGADRLELALAQRIGPLQKEPPE